MPGKPGDPRNTKRWQRIRAHVFKRDGHACTNCGRIGRLGAHHIQPRAWDDPAYYDETNLTSLCPRCHHHADLETGAAGRGGRRGRKGGRVESLRLGGDGPGGLFALSPREIHSRCW